MTPDELNELVALIAAALLAHVRITQVDVITPADAEGTSPEIAVFIAHGGELVLVVEPA